MVWHHSLPLMNSFNKTEAAVFSCRLCFLSAFPFISLIQCYAPTNDAEEEDKEDWYEQLEQTVSKVPIHDMLLIIGDMNAKVGTDKQEEKELWEYTVAGS